MSVATSLTIPVVGYPHTLEARISGPTDAPRALVAPPHPLYGGSIGNPVVRALERALGKLGLATLAFNFRGTGESTGEPSGELDDALVDFRAAAASLAGARIEWLSGYSFGSIAALALARELGVPRVLMVAPPLAMLEPQLISGYPGEIALVLGGADEYAPVEPARARFASHRSARIEVVMRAEHFFSGSQLTDLSAALGRVLEGGA